MKSLIRLFMLIAVLLAAFVVNAQDEPPVIPAPPVTGLGLDYTILSEYTYRRPLDTLDIYDAPDGTLIETMQAGYTYVSVWQAQGGWVQIGADRWVQEDQLSGPVYPSGFSGVFIPEGGTPHTVAWMIVNIRASAEPGIVAADTQPRLSRYQLVTILETRMVDGWDWYRVGDNLWVKQTNVAKIMPVSTPPGATQHWVSIDLYEQVLIAYEGSRPVFATLISSGLPQWSTNEGQFNVWLMADSTVMDGSEGQSDFYYLEDVPNTLYFDHAIALHGAYWHNSFGYRHSHGCVNMSMMDAHWLYDWSASEWNGESGITVYVYSSGEYQ